MGPDRSPVEQSYWKHSPQHLLLWTQGVSSSRHAPLASTRRANASRPQSSVAIECLLVGRERDMAPADLMCPAHCEWTHLAPYQPFSCDSCGWWAPPKATQFNPQLRTRRVARRVCATLGRIEADPDIMQSPLEARSWIAGKPRGRREGGMGYGQACTSMTR